MANVLQCCAEVREAIKVQRKFVLAPTITRLVLSRQGIGDEGVSLLSDSLKSNLSLTELSLHSRVLQIDDHALREVAQQIDLNKGILGLFVFNQIFLGGYNFPTPR